MKKLLQATLYLFSMVTVVTPCQVFSVEKKSGNVAGFCLTETSHSNPGCGKTPMATFDKDGRLNIVYVADRHIKFTSSNDKGKTFSEAVNVTAEPEELSADGENRPKIVIGQQNQIYISWVKKTEGRYTGDLRFSRSLDGGRTFSKPTTINDDGLLTSHRYESMAVDADDNIHMVWLDKRDLVAAKKQGKEYSGSAIYYAVSDNSGQSFSKNRKIADHTCECCRTSLEFTQDGEPVVLWRHVFEGSIRDHAIGFPNAIKTEPERVTFDNWETNACPHHGPDLAIDKKNRSHITWFTGAKEKGGLFYGRYDHQTQALENKISISSSPAASRPQVFVMDNQVILAWKIFEGNTTVLRMMVSKDDGKSWSESITTAETSGASDHPQILASGDQVFISWWTENEGFLLLPLDDEMRDKKALSELKPFKQDSLSQIEKLNGDNDFFLVFWSIDCPPCFKELQLFAKNAQSENFPRVVLVATDNADLLPEIRSTLIKQDLMHFENWYFDGIPEQLRITIDSEWYGEIPRTYYYSNSGSRIPHSGTVDQNMLDKLLAVRD